MYLKLCSENCKYTNAEKNPIVTPIKLKETNIKFMKTGYKTVNQTISN